MRTRLVLAMSLLLFVSLAAHGQTKMPPETHNAALRYWQAFAELKDPPAAKEIQEQLERVASGEAAWDEKSLAGILAANENALGIMRRATKLPECDWGLEYDRGPQASIAIVPRAHVLARLNTLDGIRKMAKGEPQDALDSWIAGIRFAQDLAKGGSLIFSLTAKGVLHQQFAALTVQVKQARLNNAQKKQLSAAVSSVPEDAFDWSRAWEFDEASTDIFFAELQRSPNPARSYELVMGEPPPKGCVPPSAQQLQTYHEYMAAAAAALRRPEASTKQSFAELSDKAKGICPAIRQAIPSLERLNDARAEIIVARRNLLEALAAR